MSKLFLFSFLLLLVPGPAKSNSVRTSRMRQQSRSIVSATADGEGEGRKALDHLEGGGGGMESRMCEEEREKLRKFPLSALFHFLPLVRKEKKNTISFQFFGNFF